jgi:phage antirepressor YoqD-like protein
METVNINPPQTYQYNGYDITFFKGENLMINATEMAKVFNRRVNDFLRLKATEDYIDVVSTDTGIPATALIQTIRGGGSEQGTWMHEDVAIEFARWLSPRFGKWCNDKIKELMTTGYTKLDSISRKDLAKMLFEAEETKERVAAMAELQQKQLQEAAPKVKYYESVLQSQSTYNTNQIAKELGMSAVTLNKKLRDLGIQYKQGGTWLLYAQYENKGYTKTRTHIFKDSEGEERTNMRTVWTEKGRLFIHEKLKNVRTKAVSLPGGGY